jgi:hypothetical protein
MLQGLQNLAAIDFHQPPDPGELNLILGTLDSDRSEEMRGVLTVVDTQSPNRYQQYGNEGNHEYNEVLDLDSVEHGWSIAALGEHIPLARPWFRASESGFRHATNLSMSTRIGMRSSIVPLLPVSIADLHTGPLSVIAVMRCRGKRDTAVVDHLRKAIRAVPSAVQPGLLTLCAMCKAVDRRMVMTNVGVLEKTGGG